MKIIAYMILFSVAAFLAMLILLLIKNLHKLKLQKMEIDNFNELRKAFIDSKEDLISLKDEKGRYIFANQALQTLYKRTESEMVGCEDCELADNEFAKIQRESDRTVLEQKKLLQQEIHWQDRVYSMKKFPVKLPNGKYGIGAYIEDITEAYHSKKTLQKNLHRNQILVEMLGRDFDSTKKQLDWVLNESLKLTESKYGYIFLYNEESREFTLSSYSEKAMADCDIEEYYKNYPLEQTGLWGEVVRQRKPIIVNDYSLPNPLKKGYPPGHVQLANFMSIPIIIDGKIVAVAGMANKDSDYDDNDVYQVTTLMKAIWNAKGRREALIELTVERNRFLQTILSIGDGVIVVDLEGKITLLNKIAERLTGWTTQEAMGRHYKEVLVLSHEDGHSAINDPIAGVLDQDTIQVLGDYAVLTSKSGTKYNLEDSAAPIKDNKNQTIGVVLVFRDATEKRERIRKIEYLSTHDTLTGLYNRVFLEKELKKLDNEKNLPIAIIFGDMNNLKLTNDIFGHESGDQLLQKTAEMLKKVCKPSDIVARVGGDEFIVLMSNTSEAEARHVIYQVKSQLGQERVKNISGSISMGCAVKKRSEEDILQLLKKAEKRMYTDKILEHEQIKAATIKTIITTLHNNYPQEKEHSCNVSLICEKIGKAMLLSQEELKKLREAGFLHDIGKITLEQELLNKNSHFTEDELKEISQHPVTGHRILKSFDSTLDLAEIILAHHENWDGSGYPKGLKGEEIHKLARIIAVANSYDHINREALSNQEALKELKKQAGHKLDPYIVDVFLSIMQEQEQPDTCSD